MLPGFFTFLMLFPVVSIVEVTAEFAYVGTYCSATGGGRGIYVYEINSDQQWRLIQTMHTANPSFLVVSKYKDYLYAVNELEHGDGLVSAFHRDSLTGQLTFLSSQTASGIAPCHLCLDEEEQYLAVANYGGSVAVFQINPDGSVGNQTDLLINKLQNEPSKTSHAHMVTIVPGTHDDQQQLQVVDLGFDQVFLYNFNSSTGTINPEVTAWWASAAGDGPRHSAFSMDGQYFYVVNEYANTVTTFPYKLELNIEQVQNVSTLPEDWSGVSYGSEIMLHPSGKFLYTSNRGHDSIAIFAVNTDNGHLSAIGHQSTKGKFPRHFQIHNDILYVANQHSNNITIFQINSSNGQLADLNRTIHVPSPACILIV